MLHRTEKAGLGTAYVVGFGWGLERGYDVLVEMDADGSHQPEELPRLLEPSTRRTGPRRPTWCWDRAGSTAGWCKNWPRSRLLLSRGGNAYVRMALGLHAA